MPFVAVADAAQSPHRDVPAQASDAWHDCLINPVAPEDCAMIGLTLVDAA
jgi:hypothetical protein